MGWLGKFHPFESGIPSHDVPGKVFAALDPEAFSTGVLSHGLTPSPGSLRGKVVSIDGKARRGSGDRAKICFIRCFSLCSLCHGQVADTFQKQWDHSDPELPALLALQGYYVAPDAVGWEKSIARAIREKGADYVSVVGESQKGLKDQAGKLCSTTPVKAVSDRNGLGHGRIEHRKCEVADQLRFPDDKQEWLALKTVVRITS